ncbi:MAG: hypothetical protein LIP06_05565 [Tannerellaceae bacterium]|nr:hypothetical protein [Tannerellaceae bacterium]
MKTKEDELYKPVEPEASEELKIPEEIRERFLKEVHTPMPYIPDAEILQTVVPAYDRETFRNNRTVYISWYAHLLMQRIGMLVEIHTAHYRPRFSVPTWLRGAMAILDPETGEQYFVPNYPLLQELKRLFQKSELR